MEIKIKSRVVYSGKAKRTIKLRYPDRCGVVIKHARPSFDDPTRLECVLVLWDGRKVPESIHKSFLSVVPDCVIAE
jgi:hypothetical protein